jgi:1,4-dihydroxy-2-naphthoate octaprenyltransferase
LGIGIIITLSGLLLDVLNPIAFILWLLGTFTGMAYSLPPFKFAWRGWSEVINAGLIALVLPLYGFAIHTRRFDWYVLLGCLPFALLIFILILSTNWADRDADAQVGKVTLANRLAPQQLRRVYAWAMIAGFVIQPLLTDAVLPSLVVLSSLPAIPFMIWAAIRFTKIHSPHPTVLAMLVMMPLQLGAWYLLGP